MALLVPCPMHECPCYPSCFPCPLVSALTKTLALVGGTIHEYLGGNNIAKGQEHLHQLIVSKLLREMVDEEIAAFRTCRHGGKGEEQNSPQREGEEKGAQLRAQHWMRTPVLPPSVLTSPCLSPSVTGPGRVLRALLRAAGRQHAELEFLESRFTFTACPVPMWGAGHNYSCECLRAVLLEGN